MRSPSTSLEDKETTMGRSATYHLTKASNTGTNTECAVHSSQLPCLDGYVDYNA